MAPRLPADLARLIGILSTARLKFVAPSHLPYLAYHRDTLEIGRHACVLCSKTGKYRRRLLQPRNLPATHRASLMYWMNQVRNLLLDPRP
jgi:hypothetical protein